ncbi:MAG: hypothetical protein LVQ96_00775 [Thermoplasmatales archaeon]|nr:hypothetical protein [Thermoplasmatales archaeon]MCW6169690.1 hypothetical protein [Thermoplasmatales archaeon]
MSKRTVKIVLTLWIAIDLGFFSVTSESSGKRRKTGHERLSHSLKML